MKKYVLFVLLLVTVMSVSAQMSQLDRSGKNTILKVDGKPFFMLSGELHNSTCSNVDYLDNVWDNLVKMNLNSVIATASWELVEPQEGVFDFSHVDAIIKGAREHKLKVALIWFGSFKNPFMTYAPNWVKKNPSRFPRAKDPSGKELELPTLYDSNIIEADKKAYLALLKHIKDVDKAGTVIMIQVGNEPGLKTPTRDCSASANKAWNSDVPHKVIDYLVKNKGTMQPDIEAAWKNNGYQTKGDWETIFGKSLTKDNGTKPILHLTEHLFTAFAFANYLEELSTAGKKILPLPTFTNATGSVNSRGRSLGNGCSIPDFYDIYKAVAPSLDILTPNAYPQNLDEICEAFSYKNNPILIPESNISAVRPFYLIGEWDAIGFSPFGIDYSESVMQSKSVKLLGDAYSLINRISDFIAGHLNSDKMRGVYIYSKKPEETIEMGNYSITFSRQHTNEIGVAMLGALTNGNQAEGERVLPPSVSDLSQKENASFEGGAMIIQIGTDDFFIEKKVQ
ncbi:DUF5597 domain-containing protein [Parabacteroides sp. PF5-9]|uniref:DUF5597 domain-containing protein n=1 Tax=Parabacteroides sp. PF5-9 TaxID=1742404 RepID=UPI002474C647|nr:DUF5597 domain-containing protein [Parabacteroides sp. PF5-9]MDH6357323.1 hypothetical protein [Parabacteroides sp. PF5-9]